MHPSHNTPTASPRARAAREGTKNRASRATKAAAEAKAQRQARLDRVRGRTPTRTRQSTKPPSRATQERKMRLAKLKVYDALAQLSGNADTLPLTILPLLGTEPTTNLRELFEKIWAMATGGGDAIGRPDSFKLA